MMKNRVVTVSVAALLLGSSVVYALPFEATHYPLNSNHDKVLFKTKRTEKTEAGFTTSHIVYTAPDGSELAVEDLETQNGVLKSYAVDKKQLGEKGLLVVKDGKLLFNYTKGGKTATDDEKWRDNVVVGPTLVDYIKSHWGDIMAGRDVDVRFAALDRKETVGFKLFKVSEEKRDGQDVVVVKMKPTSFVIAAIVDPIFFVMPKSGEHALEVKGRTLPKQKVGGKWKDLDTESVYTYP